MSATRKQAAHAPSKPSSAPRSAVKPVGLEQLECKVDAILALLRHLESVLVGSSTEPDSTRELYAKLKEAGQ
jgi:hypothetical protein